MTFGELKTLVWSWLDDPLAQYFTPAQVTVWLNNAQRETQKLLLQAGENYYVTKMSGLTIANQDTYALPSDFKVCHKFEVVTSPTGVSTGGPNERRNTMTPVTYIQLEEISQSTGLPCAYNIRRNIVTLRPIPDQAYTLYLSQSYRVVDMVNDADIPDVPEDYTEYLAVLATRDGFMKDQRSPTDFLNAKLERYEKMFKQDAQKRDVSAPRSVVVTDGFTPGIYF